jgi:DNA-binding winged helix-turn-helix (wHTH) protein
MRVVFGDCEFDSGRRALLRHGRAVPLSPKAFQLLEVLLDRRPEAVAKAELLERLWPETFVSDASLHNLMAEIRAALGDAPRAARFIRTIPRYGYAFHGTAQTAPIVDIPSRSGPRLVSSGGEWALSEGATFVGRDRECAVRIDSPTLSRRHARFVVAGGETTVEDLGSKNGTQVNGQRIRRPVELKDSDQIQVGSLTLTYYVLDNLPSTLTRRRTKSNLESRDQD